MKYYFNRTTRNISRIKLYSYELIIVGIVSIIFYSLGDTPKIQFFAKMLMGVSFGICALLSILDVLNEIKTEKRCNLYDLTRGIVCCIICLISFTCIDAIIG